MPNNVEAFLRRFHAGKDVDTIFTCGCCYWFAVILHTRFPQSRIMYDVVENHFMVEIDGKLYDITGDVTDKYHPIAWDSYNDSAHRARISRDCILF